MTATDNSKMSSTPKRTRITYKKRQEILLASKKPGFKIEDAVKEYGLGVSTLYKIVKEHEGGHGPREDVKCKRTLPDLQVKLEKRLIQCTVCWRPLKSHRKFTFANNSKVVNGCE